MVPLKAGFSVIPFLKPSDRLAKIRKMVVNGKHEDSIGTQLDACGEAVERYENRVYWLKFIVVIGVIAYHI